MEQATCSAGWTNLFYSSLPGCLSQDPPLFLQGMLAFRWQVRGLQSWNLITGLWTPVGLVSISGGGQETGKGAE